MNNITATQYKTYANDVVGVWYNDASNEIMMFSFLSDCAQQADLLIVDDGIRMNLTYNILNKEDGDWMLVMWNEQEYKIMFYNIEFLNPDVLIMTSSKLEVKQYQRNIDHAFANEILNGIQ